MIAENDMPCNECASEQRCFDAGLCQEYRAKIVETPKTCAPGRFCARYARGLGGCVAGFCNPPWRAAMSDMSKWPPSKDGKFTQAWINLDRLPGGMMQSYSAERGHFTYGPIPAFTSCAITTNPDDAERWRADGKPVMAIYTADGVRVGA